MGQSYRDLVAWQKAMDLVTAYDVHVDRPRRGQHISAQRFNAG